MSSPVFGNLNAKLRGGQIAQGNIVDTSIDMNLRRITTVGSPIDATDAATKSYVDMAAVTSGSVLLIGTTYGLLRGITYGTMIVTLGGILDGPTGTFIVSKNNPTGSVAITTLSQLPGSGTETFLEVKWDDNAALLCRKTTVSHDGTYAYRII